MPDNDSLRQAIIEEEARVARLLFHDRRRPFAFLRIGNGVFPVGQTDPATVSRRQAGWMCPPGSVAKKENSYRVTLYLFLI